MTSRLQVVMIDLWVMLIDRVSVCADGMVLLGCRMVLETSWWMVLESRRGNGMLDAWLSMMGNVGLVVGCTAS